MRIARVAVSFAAALIVLYAATILLSIPGQKLPEGIGAALYFFVISIGLSSFLAFTVASLISPREYRFILLGALLYLFYAYQIARSFPPELAFWRILGNIIRLSFAALGAYLAIALTSRAGKVRYRRKTGAAAERISTFLTVLAFLSIPITYFVVFLSFFIALGVSALLMMIVLELPRVPVALIAGIGLAPLVSVWAAIKGLMVVFRPPAGEVVGLSVDLGLAPTFKALVQEVCRRVGTVFPEKLLIVTEPSFFVTQSSLKTLDGGTHFGRILAVGAPLLYELESLELKSVLSHEFAHFTGKDTLYSRRVLPVFRTISSVLQSLTAGGGGGFAGFVIEVLLMVPRYCIVTFVRYFASIDSLLSRSRELRADRVAAESFGSEAFRSALVKVSRNALFYQKSLDNLRPEGNFFAYVHGRIQASAAQLDETLAEEAKRAEDVFDSHPSLAARIDAIPQAQPFAGGDYPMQRVIEELSAVLAQLSTRMNEFFADGQNGG
jgi:Zn-dependent protease with chaperone function